jgi:hypothetical protein
VNSTLSGACRANAMQLAAPAIVTTAPASAEPPIITRCSVLVASAPAARKRRRDTDATPATAAKMRVEPISVVPVVSGATRLAATVLANSSVPTPPLAHATRASREAAAASPAPVATRPLTMIGDHQPSPNPAGIASAANPTPITLAICAQGRGSATAAASASSSRATGVCVP